MSSFNARSAIGYLVLHEILVLAFHIFRTQNIKAISSFESKVQFLWYSLCLANCHLINAKDHWRKRNHVMQWPGMAQARQNWQAIVSLKNRKEVSNTSDIQNRLMRWRPQNERSWRPDNIFLSGPRFKMFRVLVGELAF